MTAIKICKRCEEEFEPKNCRQERCEKCEKYIVAQTLEAKTGRVTTRCGGSIPVWIAFRCLYCGEYFNQTEAEIHFGKTRIANSEESGLRTQLVEADETNTELRAVATYFFNFPTKGVGNNEVHKNWVERAEQILK